MAVNYMSAVPKLLGRENYEDWAFSVENVFILEGLSKCISGTETDADKVLKAKAKLVLTLDPSLFVHVKEAQTASEIWTTLKKLYDDTGFTRRIGLLRALISLRLENCDSMESYVNQVVETAQRLRRTGFKIDDEWIGSLLLAGLPEKFAPMIMAIEHSGIEVKTDIIKTKLLDMQVDGSNGQNAGSALVGKADFRFKKYPHYSKDGGSSPGSSNKKKNDIVCYKCKQPGHFKNKCPQLVNENKKEKGRQPRVTERSSSAFSTVFLNGKFNNTDWYIDSGASMHFTSRKDWLKNVQTEPELKEITVANDAKVPVVCEGSIEITTMVGNQNHNVVINNAFYVPQLTTNLLSVSQLIRNGNKVIFEASCCKIYNKKGDLVAIADVHNNVYKLNYRKTNDNLLVASAVTGDIWHRRFGHLNYGDLKLMSEGSVEGFDCKGKLNSNEVCVVCCEGKQSRLPFKHKGSRATDLLEVVHSDLCGPMEVKSLGGSRYFLLFEDDCSRMSFVYFLKAKDEAIDRFKEFKDLVENQVDRKIKILRTDNGGEFCSSVFESFLKVNGIIHQKTNPYTPEQNGMSERMNRTIVEKARCLLFDGNLSKIFWAEAVNTAVYLRNRSVVTGLDKTPVEMWSNKKPDVGHIRIFGSEVMVHIPKEKRCKWDKKAIKMTLVGFSENIKGYRLYDPVKKVIVTSRDVIIMEDVTTNFDVVFTDDSSGAETSPVPVGDEIENDGNSPKDSSDLNSDLDETNESDTEFVLPYVEPDIVRRSERPRKPTNFKDYVTYIIEDNTPMDNDPITMSEALSRPDGQKWKEAMVEEIESLKENEAWKLMDLPDGENVVDCKWVYKIKRDSDNNVSYRARLVARGFTQREGVDYSETFAPVVRHSTLRLLIALTIELGLKITHLDVKAAFLNGYLEENVYMRQPEGFVTKGFENKVCKLNRAIYGLKQSSRTWNKRVDEILLNLGCDKSKYEPCLYTRKHNGLISIIALYVDDFFVFSNDVKYVDFLKQQLNLEFKIKDLGEARQCLGVRIRRDYKKNIITLDQESYIDQVLKTFNMVDCKSVVTPMEINNVCLDDSKVSFSDKDIPYQRLVGSLMYLAVLTRPDIAFAVSHLSQYNNCYTSHHWKCAKRVLRYLKGTKSFRLSFSKDNCQLNGYTDADWASNNVDRRSYTGFVFKLSNAAISWESRKQRTVALSSTEAEYIALSEASKEAIYLKKLLAELIDCSGPIVLYNDSQSAQKLSANPLYHRRSKHIDVRHHFVREAVSNKLVTLKYLATNAMTADILTKGLPAAKHLHHVKNLGLENCSK